MTIENKPDQVTSRPPFVEEFIDVLRCRDAFRRYMPTPDKFPLFCELVDAAKAFYVGVPRHVRNNSKYIHFVYFDREWVMRSNTNLLPPPGQAYIDICDAESKTRLVTVAVGFGHELPETVRDA